MATPRPVYILGVGMTKFVKPQPKNDYVDMGYEAGIKALLDAHITYDEVQQGVASYVYGDSTCGQRVFYQFGMTRIPIYNVNNNCASGSTAVVMARDFIRYGASDCVLAVGFEKMAPGSLGSMFNDRTDPLDRAKTLNETIGDPNFNGAPFAPQMFGNAADEYMNKFGASPTDFAEIARVNHEHSQRNPYAQFQTAFSEDQVLNSPTICGVLTKLQCCPTSDGAAAAVLVSQSFLDKRPRLKAQAVQIMGQCLASDSPAYFENSSLNLVGYEMVANTAQKAFEQADASIDDVKVVELHDCFSTNEMILIDSLGLSPKGKAHEYVRRGGLTYGTDRAVVNPSGGLISKGHPLGATGLAQCAELVWQLRGWANNRLVSVPAGKLALQQNAGLGGAYVVTVLRRADRGVNKKVDDLAVGSLTGLGYNPAVQAKGITEEQAAKVRSKSHSQWAIGKAKTAQQQRI